MWQSAKIQMSQYSKTQNVTKLKNPKMWLNLKTQNVTKLKIRHNSKCNNQKTQNLREFKKLKMWQSSKSQNVT